MYISVTNGTVKYDRITFLSYVILAGGKKLKLSIVSNKDGVVESKSFLFTASGNTITPLETLLNQLVSGLSASKTLAVDLGVLAKTFQCKVTSSTNQIADVLGLVYAQIDLINGYVITRTAIIAISGITYEKDQIKLYLGSVLVATIPLAIEWDNHLISKLDKAAFSSDVRVLDMIQADNYITRVRRESTSRPDEIQKINYALEWSKEVKDNAASPKTKKSFKKYLANLLRKGC